MHVLLIHARATIIQGEENKGYEVLLHNMKAGVTASKELGEFIKER